MAVLYITSAASCQGKTALAAALGKRGAEQGHKVGFFKPLSPGQRPKGARDPDRDADFLRSVLNLSEPVDLLCPPDLPREEPEAALLQAIRAAYNKVSSGKELMIVEGMSSLETRVMSLSRRLATALEAQAILISNYFWGMNVQELIVAAKEYQDRFAGILLNAVPQTSLHRVQTEVVPQLNKERIKVLGVIPEERMLLGITVGDLARHLNGKFLTCSDKANQLVEYFMVGVFTLDNAVPYLQHYPNKAVIVRGDRQDVQWASMDTSTKCIIATGNKMPTAYVIERSQNEGVPVILVECNTHQTLSALEPITNQATIYHPDKVTKFLELLTSHCALSYLDYKLGWS